LTAPAHPELHERWTHRLDLLGEDPFGDPYHPSRERLELATYPEAVTMTGLYASRHWRERDDLAAEALRRLAIPRRAHPPASGQLELPEYGQLGAHAP